MGKRSRSRSNKKRRSRSRDDRKREPLKKTSKWSDKPPADIDPSYLEKQR
jgi:hypothetical protein